MSDADTRSNDRLDFFCENNREKKIVEVNYEEITLRLKLLGKRGERNRQTEYVYTDY